PQAAVIEKGKIIPPSKKVTFQKSEAWNDGLLEKLYAERHGRSIEETRDELHRIIAEIRFELDATGKVALPGLGTLKQTPSREVTFGLAKNLNLQKDSFGLDEVKIAPKAWNNTAKKPNPTGNADAAKSGNIPLFVLFCVMLAAIAALTLFFLLNRVRSKDSVEILLGAADEAPQELSASWPEEQGIAEDSEDEADEPEAKPAPAAARQPAPSASPLLPAEAAKAPPQAAPRCEFCTVVASFNTREGARLKMERYKKMGYNSARVIDGENNRYRVALGCYRTHEAAKQGLQEAAKFVKDAWILEVCR
ncbi:MAG: SPOR domain-containing protein, partial [Prevotellaceae bacterium]|nr:SPOR domain-containing protein [Prevotellaceae bacterium]